MSAGNGSSAATNGSTNGDGRAARASSRPRLTVRLDDETWKMLDALTVARGGKFSTVVNEAIRRFYLSDDLVADDRKKRREEA